jgi:hypothetical protein
MSDETFRWVITGGVAISTLCILVTAIAAASLYKVISAVQRRVDGVVKRIEPIIEIVHSTAVENIPKFNSMASDTKVIVANAKNISEIAKEQAHRFAEVGRDLADRTKAQVARVDAAVDDTVDQVQHAGENLKTTVLKPVREASAVLAGVKAAVSSFSRGRGPTIDHITQDEEMFI